MKYIAQLLLFTVVACSHKTNLKGFDALTGKWESKQPEGVFTESWKINEDRMCGTGYMLNNGDTVFSEKFLVAPADQKLFYTAYVKGQAPVVFTCNNPGAHKWVFENPQHDFPKKLTYILKAGPAITVILDGEEDGKIIHKKLEFIKTAQ